MLQSVFISMLSASKVMAEFQCNACSFGCDTPCVDPTVPFEVHSSACLSSKTVPVFKLMLKFCHLKIKLLNTKEDVSKKVKAACFHAVKVNVDLYC